MASRARRPISDEKRKALRKWHSTTTPRPTLEACGKWWNKEYGYTLSSSTAGEILSIKYMHLDASTTSSTSRKRARIALWPDLENALFEWEQRY